MIDNLPSINDEEDEEFLENEIYTEKHVGRRLEKNGFRNKIYQGCEMVQRLYWWNYELRLRTYPISMIEQVSRTRRQKVFIVEIFIFFFQSFLSDPGVPGVRSMGPVLCNKLTFLTSVEI